MIWKRRARSPQQVFCNQASSWSQSCRKTNKTSSTTRNIGSRNQLSQCFPALHIKFLPHTHADALSSFSNISRLKTVYRFPVKIKKEISILIPCLVLECTGLREMFYLLCRVHNSGMAMLALLA